MTSAGTPWPNLLMMKYPLVTQEEEWGCGVACVASVLGCKYDKARTYFPAAIRNHAKYKGFSGLQLSRALLRGGKRYAKRAKHYKRDPLEPGTIVSVSKTKGKYKGSGHHLVTTTGKRFMDPLGPKATYRRKPRNIQSYLPPL